MYISSWIGDSDDKRADHLLCAIDQLAIFTRYQSILKDKKLIIYSFNHSLDHVYISFFQTHLQNKDKSFTIIISNKLIRCNSSIDVNWNNLSITSRSVQSSVLIIIFTKTYLMNIEFPFKSWPVSIWMIAVATLLFIQIW